MAFSQVTRTENIKRLKSEEFDLCIIGGGISGAGVARDAASRGLKVALIEANDYASGTSSRSSKLIHGGVRYLENFEFGLVFEALSERSLLFKMAPHLVHPLRFVIPIYKNSRVGFWKMWAGMWLYDILALFRTPQLHESLSRQEVRKRVPSLGDQGLTGAVEYSDAYTDDDRLVIESLRDAARKGAVQVNYVKATGGNFSESLLQSVKVEDSLNGDKFEVKATHFVSGVGPWTDIFGETLHRGWQPQLRPTKGVHLVFAKERIPVEKAIVMGVETRIIFVIPRHEMVIVGTTDTDFSMNPRDVFTDTDDVHYILQALDQYFPDLKIQKSDILSSYCGVRPLVNDGSSTEGKTSRSHRIWTHGSNLTFVAGGKYTTYRKISEEVVDHVLSQGLSAKAKNLKAAQTKEPLNPLISETLYKQAIDKIDQWSKDYQISQDHVEFLVHRYGEEALKLLENIRVLDPSLSEEVRLWMAEAAFSIEETMCLSLTDFYWRRSPLFLSRKDHGMDFIEPLTQVFQQKLKWTDEEAEQQKDDLLLQMKRELSWQHPIA
jgi:glycerol-3-phosphate dehydrogenase